MERCKKVLRTLLYPHAAIIFPLTVLSAAGLCHVFLTGLETHPIAYAVYTLSFYALCVLVAAMPPMVKKCRALLYGNTHAARYLTQRELRIRASLYGSTAINLAYAVFKLFTGIWFRSVWFGAVAVYYMVLCLIRFLLLQNDRKVRRMDSPDARLLRQWWGYRVCGWLLLLLNAAMTGMVVQMIWQNKSYTYPGFVIYAAAAYTFYRLPMAIVRMVKLHRSNDPVFSAAKAMDLSVALMALFALQTAMFASFGAETSAFTRRLMNTLTGGTVCLAVVCIAVFMIVRSHRALTTMQISKTETQPYQGSNTRTIG